MKRRLKQSRIVFVLVLLLARPWGIASAEDPLPSWRDGATKRAIVGFVAETTREGGPQFVPPAKRIATFDQDGTLWVEQPVYTQVVFAVDRVVALAPHHPEWKTQEPFQSILSHQLDALANFTIQDFEKVVAVTHTGSTVEEFQRVVREWLAAAKHPRFMRPYTQCVYQPMLELMRYLRESGYKTYIVTGGGQEFVRAYAERVYGVPPEQVVGSAGKVKYEYGAGGRPELVKLPEVLLIDDKAGKPEGINLIIGRRPYAAFGNSTGDRQMLEYTGAGDGARLMMLVLHDDAEREYAYGPAEGLPDSKVGTFTQALYDEAQTKGWTVISMKNDWNRIFSFDE